MTPLWRRYFCCFGQNRLATNHFLLELNNFHPRKIFTLKKEANGSFHFLDLTLTKTNNEINIAIYGKFTYTATTISSDYLHLWQHKNANFNSMVHRLINLTETNENFKKELKTMKHVARNSGESQESKSRNKFLEFIRTNKQKASNLYVWRKQHM